MTGIYLLLFSSITSIKSSIWNPVSIITQTSVPWMSYRSIASESDICRSYPVFGEDSSDFLSCGVNSLEWNMRERFLILTSCSRWLRGCVLVILMPPLSFFLNTMFGGCLLIRIPKPSSSVSMTFLSVKGFKTSSTMKIKWHVFATAMTCRPRPLPSFAPSMIPIAPKLDFQVILLAYGGVVPGRSSIWILAPL